MIRRSFFQTLAAALLPQPVIAMAKAVQPGCEPTAGETSHITSLCPFNSPRLLFP